MENELRTTLPAEKAPYLLRDSAGPRYRLGNQLAAIIASANSTGNLFELVLQSHHTRLLAFSMNDGVAGLYARVGEATSLFVHPPQGNGIDLAERLRPVAGDLDITLADDLPTAQL